MEGFLRNSFFLLFLTFGFRYSGRVANTEFTSAEEHSEELRAVRAAPGFHAKGDTYNFPWTCWLNTQKLDLHVPRHPGYKIWPAPIGMCSILNTKHVFGGVDNLRDINGLRNGKTTVDKLWVFTGSAEPGDPFCCIQTFLAQHYPVREIWISLGPRPDKIAPNTPKDHWSTGDWENTSIQWDVIGAAFNLALIEIAGDFFWTAYIIPMPIRYDRISENRDKISHILSFLDIHPHARAPCSILTYGPTGRPRFTQVSYVPRSICKAVYCSVDMGYCFRFPFEWYHMCFRSVIFSDPCKFDQGAALYCNWWNRTVFGILSNSDNCGIDGLPAVYTAIAAPLLVFAHAKAQGSDSALTSRPFGRNIDFNRVYTLPPNVPTPADYDYDVH